MSVDRRTLLISGGLGAMGLALPRRLAAQGFAGLGGSADGFPAVTPNRTFIFPADHGAHSEHRIEWWYVTANLADDKGRPLGLQWTLFRQATTPGPQRDGWSSQQTWMGHAAVTSGERHLFAEKLARGGIGQAGATAEPFDAWIDDWRMQAVAGASGICLVRLTARAASFAYDVTLTTSLPVVLQGAGGYSVKSASGQASYYYSQPFYAADGTLTIEGVERRVTGRAWLDREWGSQPLAADQDGWDWFSLHLDGGAKVMLFRLRHRDGRHFQSGTWIEPTGKPAQIAGDDIALEPGAAVEVAGRAVPVTWRIAIPSRAVTIALEPVNPQSWMGTSFPYWEGPVRISGGAGGVGYLEMTGY